MMVIITGENRVEVCIPNRRQEGLHFYKSRGQLYRIFPNCLYRIRKFDYDGLEIGSEEGIIYRENDVVPYDTADFDYRMDRLLSDVYRHKNMMENKILKPTMFFTNARSIIDWLIKGGGFVYVIVGLVLLYAFFPK